MFLTCSLELLMGLIWKEENSVQEVNNGNQAAVISTRGGNFGGLGVGVGINEMKQNKKSQKFH